MVEFTADYDRSESDSLHSAIDTGMPDNNMDGSEPPAWMQAFMQTQRQLLEQNHRETEQRIAALAAQIQNLRTSMYIALSWNKRNLLGFMAVLIPFSVQLLQ